MNREESKMKARMGLALASEEMGELDGTELSDIYPRQVKERADLQKPAAKEEPRTVVQKLPAWIKAQAEQLEMRRKARQRLEMLEFPATQKAD